MVEIEERKSAIVPEEGGNGGKKGVREGVKEGGRITEYLNQSIHEATEVTKRVGSP
jgi:hypothetical protein